MLWLEKEEKKKPLFVLAPPLPSMRATGSKAHCVHHGMPLGAFGVEPGVVYAFLFKTHHEDSLDLYISSRTMKGGAVAFRGSIAFTDAEAASRLINLMHDISIAAVEFFNHSDSAVRMSQGATLSGQVKEATELLQGFVTSTRTEKYRTMCQEHLAKCSVAAKQIDQIITNAQSLEKAVQTELETAFDAYFGGLQKLMDCSESEVSEVIARNVQFNIQAVSDIRDKVGTFSINSLIDNIDAVCIVVLRSFRNRASISQDEDRIILEKASEHQKEGNLDRIKALSLELDAGNKENDPERLKLCNDIIECSQQVLGLLNQSIVTHESFAPPKDVENFATIRSKETKARKTEEGLACFTIDQVCALFQSLGASETHLQTLRTEGIDGQALTLLSNEELNSELHLPFGVRKKFANYLLVESASPAAAEPPKARPGPVKRPGASTNKNISLSAGDAARGGTIRRRSIAVDNKELDDMLSGLMEGL